MLHLFYDGGADYMTSLKTIIKKIEDMELLLKFLIGDRISIFNESGETVIAGNDMTEFKSELESNMKSIRSFIDSSLMLFWKEYAVSKYPRFFPVPFEIKRNTELMIKFVELKVGIFKDERMQPADGRVRQNDIRFLAVSADERFVIAQWNFLLIL